MQLAHSYVLSKWLMAGTAYICICLFPACPLNSSWSHGRKPHPGLTFYMQPGVALFSRHCHSTNTDHKCSLHCWFLGARWSCLFLYKHLPFSCLQPPSGTAALEWTMHPGVIHSRLSEYALGLSGTNFCFGDRGDRKLVMGLGFGKGL